MHAESFGSRSELTTDQTTLGYRLSPKDSQCLPIEHLLRSRREVSNLLELEQATFKVQNIVAGRGLVEALAVGELREDKFCCLSGCDWISNEVLSSTQKIWLATTRLRCMWSRRDIELLISKYRRNRNVKNDPKFYKPWDGGVSCSRMILFQVFHLVSDELRDLGSVGVCFRLESGYSHIRPSVTENWAEVISGMGSETSEQIWMRQLLGNRN